VYQFRKQQPFCIIIPFFDCLFLISVLLATDEHSDVSKIGSKLLILEFVLWFNFIRDRVNEVKNHVLRVTPAGASPIAANLRYSPLGTRVCVFSDIPNVHIRSTFARGKFMDAESQLFAGK
jgi:hypothetical protein